MELEFVINWGYQMLYSRRLYHAVFDWSGKLECTDLNAKLSLSLLEYPFCMFGISYNAKELPIKGNSWEGIITRRSLGGLAVKVVCEDNAEFVLKNKYGEFKFSAQEIMQNGYKYYPVGGKYDFAALSINRKGFACFQNAETNENRIVFNPIDFGGDVVEKRRLLMHKLSSQSTMILPLEMVKQEQGSTFVEIQIQGMLLKDLTKDNPIEVYAQSKEDMRWVLSKDCIEDFVADELTLKLEFSDGTEKKIRHYCRFHDFEVQLLEDIFVEIPLKKSLSYVKITNEHSIYDFYVRQIVLERKNFKHLQMELPEWGLTNRKNIGRIFAEKECQVEISSIENLIKLSLDKGWNEFEFTIKQPACNYQLKASDGEIDSFAVVKELYEDWDMEFPIMVGADLTTVPHDDNGDMERILNYIWQTQMGNTVVFRNFRPYPVAPLPDSNLLRKWGEFCRKHQIYVQSVNCHADDSLGETALEYMHNVGPHESAGRIYAGDPDENNPALNMQEASERYIEAIKNDVKANKKSYCRYGYGDAGGGARYLFMGGVEYIRAETMVPHTQHLCSLVRCASKIFGKGDWGVHIAIQHAAQPYIKDWHLGQYFLSLYQAWAMGASNFYEEDSLFTLFKDVQQGWNDDLTKIKRDMTREFFKFASTQPLKGKLLINIASIEGRYAAPFNGFVCGSEQDPNYSVWGAYGSNAPEWGHNQVEKMRHLLDVLMPNASTLPLRQKEDKRRFFFSGTPYGDFDQLPVEADVKFWQEYRLLLNLGWHSANWEDMAKISAYVKQGGVYFAGLTEYSQHLDREFLRDMIDLKLLNNGDLREFCGLKVKGRSLQEYSGKYKGVSGDEITSGIYNFSPDEDGKCYLADVELNEDVEVVVFDEENQMPLIVKHKYGKGLVYTLCAWAYPGHEKLRAVMAVFLRKLCEDYRGEIYVEDASKEVFWNVRDCGDCQLVILLNTDWTVQGNVKKVKLCTPVGEYFLDVVERLPLLVYLYPDKVITSYGNL